MKFISNNNSQTNGNTTQALVTANVQSLIEQLETGHSEVLSQYLNAMARFHTYSFGNVLLNARQKPNATHVAGIFAWNQLGRRVKRGEKGIAILAPMIGKTRGQRENAKPEESTDAKAEAQGTPMQLLGFRPVYVWDVSQTDGKELPEPDRVKGTAGSYLARLLNFVIGQRIKFGYSENIAPAKGMSYGGAIRILPNLGEAEQFSVLVHELAHEMLHKAERRSMTTKTVRETEAEAIAFVVSNAIGLETGTAASNYIQLYHGDAKLLQESLEIVRRTSAVILGAISPEVPQEVQQ